MRIGRWSVSRWMLLGLGLTIVFGLSVVMFSEAIVALSASLLGVWIVVGLAIVAHRFWRWMTYRIGVRLFLSYLLVGVSPLLLAAAVLSFSSYVAIGQYTSVRFGSEIDALARHLCKNADHARELLRSGRSQEAADVLQEMSETPQGGEIRVFWMARAGGYEHRTPGAEGLPFPDWKDTTELGEVVVHQGLAYVLVGGATGGTGPAVVGLVPLDQEAARALSAIAWHDIYFFPIADGADDAAESEGTVDFGLTVDPGDGAASVHYNNESTDMEGVWPERSASAEDSWLDQPIVYWFRVVSDVRALSTGAEIEDEGVATLLRTAPSAAWQDFTHSGYELATALRIAFFSVTGFFLSVYILAAATAAVIVFSIARSTARLSRGAKEVSVGNLGYRIPVKRRDQLGDLALSFNDMTESVQSMLEEVAEKERLARELELAREIQESLLPDSDLHHGPIDVRAVFRPAAEVGGDYFDVFPLDDDRLVVTIGDVAGHGLPTGLLMAMLKSSVASLIHEGYGGVELVNRINAVLRAQGPHRLLATFMVVEIDLEEETAVVTNAGHPPAYLMLPEVEPQELASGALPLGGRLGRPANGSYRFTAGAKVVLYSDGVVEAQSESGEPLGYESLSDMLSRRRELAGPELQTEIISWVDAHTQQRPPDDDLTLIVVSRSE